MIRRPPRSTRTDTFFPYATLFRSASPGTAIEFAPGTYEFSGRSIEITRPGALSRPIVVRAVTPGEVTLRFSLAEGFHVRAPYWVFENLVIEGACEHDSRCEHAFHVVGSATNTIIRNNRVIEFNSARSEARRVGKECVSQRRTRMSPYH